MADLEFRELNNYTNDIACVLYRNRVLYIIRKADLEYDDLGDCIRFISYYNIIQHNIENCRESIDQHFLERREEIDKWIDGIEFVEKDLVEMGLEFGPIHPLTNDYAASYRGHELYNVSKSIFNMGLMLAIVDLDNGNFGKMQVDLSPQEIVEKIRDHFVGGNIAKILDGVEIYG